jgi:hypothetical protein
VPAQLAGDDLGGVLVAERLLPERVVVPQAGAGGSRRAGGDRGYHDDGGEVSHDDQKLTRARHRLEATRPLCYL